MAFVFKKIIIILISLLLLGLAAKLKAQEYFDPFSLIKSTPQGKQLLDISQNAEFDVELAQQQLEALSKTGISDLGIEYQVAEILAYIAIYHEFSNHDEITKKLNELHLLGVKKGNDWILSKYFEQQAVLSLKQGHFLKGFEDANKAIEIAETQNYHAVIAGAKSLRGIFNGKMGHGSNALKDYLDALTFFEDSNNINRLAAIYNNLVVLYIDRKEYDQALIMSNKAIETQNKMPRKSVRTIAINYINRAIILSQLDKKDEELEAYIKAQELAIQSNDINILTSVYANLSDYFLRNENYTIAIERADKCLETSAKIKDVYTMAICLLNRGLSLVFLDKVDDGFKDLKQALAITEAENMQATLIDVYHSFILAYQSVDDHKSANVWLEKRYEVLLKQAKNDKENYFQEMEESFKQTVADRDQLHTSLKSDMMENIFKQETLVKRLWITIITLAIGLIFLLIVIFRLKNKLKPNYYKD